MSLIPKLPGTASIDKLFYTSQLTQIPSFSTERTKLSEIGISKRITQTEKMTELQLPAYAIIERMVDETKS